MITSLRLLFGTQSTGLGNLRILNCHFWEYKKKIKFVKNLKLVSFHKKINKENMTASLPS